MGIAIHLLGTPAIDGSHVDASPRGRKVWGLLAYLVSSKRSPSREELASLFFEEADDPLRALRWNLSELRRGVPGAEVSGSEAVTLTLPPDAVVDVTALRRGSWVEVLDLPGLGRDLLEGMTFSSSPVLDAWLTNERRYLRAASEALLREAAMALLGMGQAERAAEVAGRLVGLEPLNEDGHALLIQAHLAAGDRAAAEAQAESCRKLLETELGVSPGPAIATALATRPSGAGPTLATEPVLLEARRESAEGMIRAGALEPGLEMLREIAVAADAIGDRHLRARALLAAGSALVHTDRSRHEEGSALLHEVISLADQIGDDPMKAEAHRDLAWVEFMAARYDRARRWLYQAPHETLLSPGTRAGALWILGKIAMETGYYEESIELLSSAVARAREANDPMRIAFGLTSLGRSYLLRRELATARAAFEEAVSIVRFAGLARLAALPESFLAEALLLEGDLEGAEATAVHAFAGARELGDPSMECMGARALALVRIESGEFDEALSLLKDARDRMIESPDHTWSQTYALDALCDLASTLGTPEAWTWVDHLTTLAARAGMKEMLARAYLYRHRLGEADALGTARLLSADVDNPHLHAELAEVDAPLVS
ncbi:MAG TPA: BTAD domain-containing putative transcriptional regulator [Actinomycetota bacterium]|nr:BTAD domain-containing putative transcriptional regulator [Actinomycetota bacterium]